MLTLLDPIDMALRRHIVVCIVFTECMVLQILRVSDHFRDPRSGIQPRSLLHLCLLVECRWWAVFALFACPPYGHLAMVSQNACSLRCISTTHD